jgi:VanZ family protein
MSYNRSIKHYLLAYLPVLAWMGLIFLLSSRSTLPGFELSTLDFIFKKMGHVVVFGTLYFLIHRAILKTTSVDVFHPAVWGVAIALTIAYGVSDELHQAMVAGRTASIRDVGFDTLGALIVFLKQYTYI